MDGRGASCEVGPAVLCRPPVLVPVRPTLTLSSPDPSSVPGPEASVYRLLALSPMAPAR
jgi:hypothetical protein